MRGKDHIRMEDFELLKVLGTGGVYIYLYNSKHYKKGVIWLEMK